MFKSPEIWAKENQVMSDRSLYSSQTKLRNYLYKREP